MLLICENWGHYRRAVPAASRTARVRSGTAVHRRRAGGRGIKRPRPIPITSEPSPRTPTWRPRSCWWKAAASGWRWRSA